MRTPQKSIRINTAGVASGDVRAFGAYARILIFGDSDECISNCIACDAAPNFAKKIIFNYEISINSHAS